MFWKRLEFAPFVICVAQLIVNQEIWQHRIHQVFVQAKVGRDKKGTTFANFNKLRLTPIVYHVVFLIIPSNNKSIDGFHMLILLKQHKTEQF